MGWSDLGDGCVDGDGPSDRISDGLERVAAAAIARTGALPSGEGLLEAFVQSLNLDGVRAPFYSEPHPIDALLVPYTDARLRITGTRAPLWMVHEIHGTLDEVAEEYVRACHRPPHLRELVHYLAGRLGGEEFSEDDFRELISDRVPLKLRQSSFVLSARGKSIDRRPAPEPEPLRTRSLGRVVHPKFGEGEVLIADGDRLTVRFGSERRVVLRSFLTPVG